MKTRIGFKVLTIIDNRKLISYCASGSATVQYRVGKYVKPHVGHGPLAVFSSLEAALAYLSKYGALYMCRFVPSKAKRMYKPNGDTMEPTIRGTLLARKVKLLRRIK